MCRLSARTSMMFWMPYARRTNAKLLSIQDLILHQLRSYPKDLKEIRPDLPSIFLEEKVCLDPNSKDLAHLDVIIRPEQIGKKFMCTVCHRLIYSGRHRTICLRPSCFYCLRKRLQKDDWYDSNMVRDFCPSAQSHDHPAVTFLNGGAGEKCPKCHHRIWTASCMECHRNDCNGKKSVLNTD